MKELPGVLACSRVRFGSPERLRKYLGIEPGSVSLLAIINDPQHAVEVVIDEELWNSEHFQFHPLVNTRTLILSRDGIERFLAETGHEPKIASIPIQK
jgi:Ala-tRNA(Pro) deacylase